MSKLGIKAVIFDLDDTLLKTAVIKWKHHKAVADKFYGIELTDKTLGEHCGYAGAPGNATAELKGLIGSKGKQSFVGKSVDENGILDIFDYFSL